MLDKITSIVRLQGAVCILESKWHTYYAIETMMCCECRLTFVCIINLDLPVSVLSV